MATVSAWRVVGFQLVLVALLALSLPSVALAQASAASEHDLRFVSLGDWGYVSFTDRRRCSLHACSLAPSPSSHATAVVPPPSPAQVNDDQQAVAGQLARHAALINASFLLALGDNF